MTSAVARPPSNRWLQLVAGIVAMIMVANYQYAFTLFTPGMKQHFVGTPYSHIALIFTIFVIFETWPVPVAGVLIDRFGVRLLMLIGTALVFTGWLLSGAFATTVNELYISYGVITGLGAGTIYLAVTGNAIKWFPDRRGLAAGLTAAGFGGGSALTLIPISATIKAMGWNNAMVLWGTIQAVVVLAMAFILRHPPENWKPEGWVPKVTARLAQGTVSYTWIQALKMPEFYLLYLIHFLISLGGLMTLGNLSEIARYLNVETATIFGISIVAFAATANGIGSVASRIFWGLTSDRWGRENTMTFVFILEGIFIFLVTQITGSPILFVVVFPLIFFGYTQINTLLSATTGDLFGARHVSANFGMLYTAKGAAAIFSGWGAARVAAAFSGSFQAPYYIAAGCDLFAAVLAIFVLKPMVRAKLASRNAARESAERESASAVIKTQS
jgi:OFA family oxalate/formate antiporter-like MFS transporter